MLLKRGTGGKEVTEDSLDRMFPELPEGYFDDKGEFFSTPPKNIFEVYANSKVKPYIAAVDLNNSEDAPYENRPKMAYEIGVQISF